ncbi:MAG: cobalamin B12-binding domain-containing protein [Burkholderiaceae bacterium]
MPSPRPSPDAVNRPSNLPRELLRQAITHRVVPTLLGRAANGDKARVLPSEAAVLELAGHVLEESIEPARQLVRDQLGIGVSTEDMYMYLLAPAARVLGRHWETDTCNFVEVTWGMGQLQQLLREHPLSRPVSGLASPGQVLLCPLPGEQHTFGLSMVAEFLLQAGWGVQRQQITHQAEAVSWIQRHNVQVVALSVGHTSGTAPLAELARALRTASANPNLVLLAGGAGLADLDIPATHLGLNAVAGTAPDVARLAAQYLQPNFKAHR